ncbi:hypothetical protein, partial [Nocardiopsis oceani]
MKFIQCGPKNISKNGVVDGGLLGWDPLLAGLFLSVDGSLLSRRPIVAVSAARVKVVAVEALARCRGRSTLTRFAATAGRRLSGNVVS